MQVRHFECPHRVGAFGLAKRAADSRGDFGCALFFNVCAPLRCLICARTSDTLSDGHA